jgi:N-methylhydantoinase B
MLAQARSLPSFLGTLGYCIEAAVRNIGGPESLHSGDVLWSTNGFDNGSHPQDAVIVVPSFEGDALVGYAVVKAHHLDIAAKDPYSTDTTDNFQEGVIFPGVRLFQGGELQEDMFRTVLANSRHPHALEGDLNAQIAAARLGADALVDLRVRHGTKTFDLSVERMFDHGETMVRRRVESMPDGRYIARCALDDNGLTEDLVPFQVVVEITGSDVVIDFSDGPPEDAGPINCPFPTTVSSARCALLGLVGGNEMPNEGHFRPLEVRARLGTLFCPRPPAPIFLYGWASDQAIEGLGQALAQAVPNAVSAGSGGDLCALVLWGRDAADNYWIGGVDQPVGHGATSGGDGGGPLMIIACSGTRNTPIEVVESRYPIVVESYEFAADSGGAGRFRGGLGTNISYRATRECYMTAIVERQRTPPWGLFGGGQGRCNALVVHWPDGSTSSHRKATALRLPEGTVVDVLTGGGGGYGPPAERDSHAVATDIIEGYVTEDRARTDYPHAFMSQEGSAATS